MRDWPTETVECPECGHRVTQKNVSRNEFSALFCDECDGVRMEPT